MHPWFRIDLAKLGHFILFTLLLYINYEDKRFTCFLMYPTHQQMHNVEVISAIHFTSVIVYNDMPGQCIDWVVASLFQCYIEQVSIGVSFRIRSWNHSTLKDSMFKSQDLHHAPCSTNWNISVCCHKILLQVFYSLFFLRNQGKATSRQHSQWFFILWTWTVSLGTFSAFDIF